MCRILFIFFALGVYLAFDSIHQKISYSKCGLDESSPYNLILYGINKSNPFIFFFYNNVGLMNQAPTILKQCGFDESSPYNLISPKHQILTILFWDELVAIAKNARFSFSENLSEFYLYSLSDS
jgi:hypothetical protein